MQNESVIPGLERLGVRRKLESADMHCIISRDAENEKTILSFCRDAARCLFAVVPSLSELRNEPGGLTTGDALRRGRRLYRRLCQSQLQALQIFSELRVQFRTLEGELNSGFQES